MILFHTTALYMIATRLAVFMTAAMVIAGFSVAPFFLGAEAAPLNKSRSNLKSLVVQPEQEQTCINQVDGQGDKQAITNPDQAQAPDGGDTQATFNAEQTREGEFTQGDTDITVDSDPSNNCSQELNVIVEDNGDITDSDLTDSSTNEEEAQQ